MKLLQRFAALALAIVFLASPLLGADEKAADATDLLESVKQSATNADQLNKSLGAVFQKVATTMDSDPDAAEKLIDGLANTLSELKSDDDQVKTMLTRGKSALDFYRQRLELARISLEELKTALKEDAGDSKALSQLSSKYLQQIGAIARTKPDEAEQQLNAAKEFLTSLKDQASDDGIKQRIEQAISGLGRLERSIASGKKLAAMIGEEAVPIKAEAWVNGEPLKEGDLKGKVVLLDFWAVWCGPCIATFPHLREWHEQYADKGLEIIGVTRYYNYKWNEDSGRPARGQDVTPEEEQEMLIKFAKEHDLHHRFAIMADRSLSEYYGVSGIPHVVVIDDSGVVRLMRVGSGEANARDISEMLAKLLGE